MELEEMENKEHLSFEGTLKGERCSQDIIPGKARLGGMWQWGLETPAGALRTCTLEKQEGQEGNKGTGGAVVCYKETAIWSSMHSFLCL